MVNEHMSKAGLKYDTGKNRLGLVLSGFVDSLEQVGLVGTFGANKYEPYGWMTVPDAYDRYRDALYRHMFKHEQGEFDDPESGLPHLAHAAWNALAILHFHLEKLDDLPKL